MAHVRQTVREAFAALLDASAANLWTTVLETRIKPARDIMPFLMVYTESETTDAILIHGPTQYDRSIQITTKAYINISDDEQVENRMDAIAAEIEMLITQATMNTQLSNKCKSIALTSTDLSIETDENERTAAIVTLDWLVRVFTVEGDAETLI